MLPMRIFSTRLSAVVVFGLGIVCFNKRVSPYFEYFLIDVQDIGDSRYIVPRTRSQESDIVIRVWNMGLPRQ